MSQLIKQCVTLVLFFCCFSVSAEQQDIYPFTSLQESQRFQQLSHEVRCITCQNQSLAESSAPLAMDLRQKIYIMVKAGKSDAEIHQYLVKRYGEFILLHPSVNKLTIVLWLCPLLLLGIVLVFIFRVVLVRRR